jgi:beta-1,2-mannobiose phosphorylase / 1,2-beta-oligomannan phosphorylase
MRGTRRCGIAKSIRRELIRPGDLSPSQAGFEVIGAFNPGAVKTAEGVVLLVRVAERPREVRPGFMGLPRWEVGRGVAVDWVANDELEVVDARVVRLKSDGRTRLTFLSHLRMFRSRDGLSVLNGDGAMLMPELASEEFGVEDARITPIDGRYDVTYVAVSRQGVATALASTDDFRAFTRHGVIFGPENKDVVLFPERINGEFVAIHRPSGSAGFARPEMWLARSPDRIHWGRHQHLLGVRRGVSRIGAGPPPVRIPEGWLVIYHECSETNGPNDVGVYSACALLLAHDQPQRILARSSMPVLTPQATFEREGFVPNVVFPTGIVAQGSSLLIYYGACDTSTAVVRMSLEDVLGSMKPEISGA